MKKIAESAALLLGKSENELKSGILKNSGAVTVYENSIHKLGNAVVMMCRDDEKKLVSRVVRTAFNQRRKQLGKVLGQMFGKAEVEAVFAKLDLPMEIRPDKLEVADFVAIARELNLIAGDSDNE